MLEGSIASRAATPKQSRPQTSEGLRQPALFRMYHSRLYRWLSPDPVAGSIFDPQSLNRYAYVLNNPTTLIDPLGLQCSPEAQGLAIELGITCFGVTSNGYPTNPKAMLYTQMYYQWIFSTLFAYAQISSTSGRGGGRGGGKPPQPPKQLPEKRACIPRMELNPAGQLTLNALSFWAQETGVTYFVGVNLAGTFAKGVGATVEGSYLYAADPQGRAAIVQGLTLGGAVAGRAYGAGGQVGSATYQSVYDFAGPSHGASAQASIPGLRIPVALGGGFSTNQAGVLTFATLGIGRGARATAGEVLSVGVQVTEVCAE